MKIKAIAALICYITIMVAAAREQDGSHALM
jgi:hypothetical protein